MFNKLLYQPIPPAWVDGLRDSRTEEAHAFLEAYDRLTKEPETVALAIEVSEP